MVSLRNLTIQKKLTLILMTTSLSAVYLACGVFIAFSVYSSRQSYLNDLTGLAKVIGHNCMASLAFDVPEDAIDILSGLDARPSVVFACIYKANGQPFAIFSREDPKAEIPPAPREDFYTFKDGFLRIFHTIYFNHEMIGTLFLQDDMQAIATAVKRQVTVLALMMAIALVIAYLVSSRLQNLISKPILSLANTAIAVSRKKDYSIRAPKQSNDEVGILIDAFNEMLTQIQVRDGAIRESEERFRTLVDQGNDAFFLHDFEGNFIDVNQRACESLGYSREELLSKKVGNIDVFFPDDKQSHEQIWSQLSLGKPLTLEGVHRRKDGFCFPVEIRIGLLELKNGKYIQGLVRDITERKRTDEELSNHRDHLEELVKARTKDLENAQAELIKREKLSVLGRLTATVSHELRNPLGVIRSSIFFLQQMLKDTEEKNMKHLNRIEQQVQICDAIVAELLEYTRGKESEVIPGEINPLISEVLDQSGELKAISINRDLSPELPIIPYDSKKMRRIIINLLDNAVHAVKAEKDKMAELSQPYEPVINIHTAPFETGVLIAVEDNGVGMDEETLNHSFEPLFTTRARGTGLGLSIVKKIIEEHNGSISITSKVGMGTKVSLTLPDLRQYHQGVNRFEHGN